MPEHQSKDSRAKQSSPSERRVARATNGFGAGAAAGRVLTPATYYPVALQRQWERNSGAIAGKPYAAFFTPDLQVPVAAATT